MFDTGHRWLDDDDNVDDGDSLEPCGTNET